MIETVHRLHLSSYNTRRNLPGSVGRKRGESNFLRAFERAWFGRAGSGGLAGGEFALGGYGVADLVWIAWQPHPATKDFSAIALERQLRRRQLFAFEAKLKDWRRGLRQAFRYRYFADKAIVIMPAENAAPAIAQLAAFRELSVGLWTFDEEKSIIRRHHTPAGIRALNLHARRKAIALLSSKLDLRKFRKQPHAPEQRIQVGVV